MKFVLAPGWVKSAAHAFLFKNAPIDALGMGSYTLEARPGNTGGRNFHHNEDFSVVTNSIGLKNPGIAEGRREVAKVLEAVSGSGVEVNTSFAGFSIEDYMAAINGHSDASHLELNFGCPNGFNADGSPKRIMSFDLVAMEEVLSCAYEQPTKHSKTERFVLVKVSPYSDPYLLKDVAELLSAYFSLIKEVIPNTFPMGMAFMEDGTPFLEVAGGFGGVSGRCMKPITLGQVAQFRKHLHPDIGVGAAGGIHHGIDVRDAKLAGATSVHIGSRAFVQGPRAIGQIVEEYAEYA